jgi:hypothetical protein
MASSLVLLPFRKITPRVLDWVGKLVQARNCGAVFSATRGSGASEALEAGPMATWHESAWCAVRAAISCAGRAASTRLTYRGHRPANRDETRRARNRSRAGVSQPGSFSLNTSMAFSRR